MHFLHLLEVREVRVGVAAAWLTEAAVLTAQIGESEREVAAKARGGGDERTADLMAPARQTMGERVVDQFGWFKRSYLGSKFRKNSGRNSGSGPFSGIFGPGVAGIIFLGIAFFRTF